MILKLLAGAGFKDVGSTLANLQKSGADPLSLLGVPGMQLILAGAGLKDVANSLEIATPILKSFMPQQSPVQQQPDPNRLAAAMSMISAQRGPGLQGIRMLNI